jgi:hypothetical protein
MPSSGMLRHVALVRTTRRNIPEDGILQNILVIHLISFRYRLQVVHNFNYRPKTLGVHEQKSLNTTGIDNRTQ